MDLVPHYTSYSESALYFDTDTSLTTAFWDAVTEAEYNENVSFDDEASQFYILFKKVEFSMDWRESTSTKAKSTATLPQKHSHRP